MLNECRLQIKQYFNGPCGAVAAIQVIVAFCRYRGYDGTKIQLDNTNVYNLEKVPFFACHGPEILTNTDHGVRLQARI